ncbi:MULTISPECIES: NAD+ synthase [unclassified Moraxella]|uniref:NAD+ synthase n=1 Tax=unclassified Moraxella TaxID=2685852 RepID=UPI003AF7D1B7
MSSTENLQPTSQNSTNLDLTSSDLSNSDLSNPATAETPQPTPINAVNEVTQSEPAKTEVGLKIAIAQQQFIVGDVIANAKKMVKLAEDARDKGANLIVFPELSLLGYPPEDLLLRPSLTSRVKLAFELFSQVKDIVMLVGYPHIDHHGTFNSVAIIHNGQQKGFYHKQCLPNYGVFDERRYFSKGRNQVIFDYQGVSIGLLICEDLWQEAPIKALKDKGADIVISLNASPFEQNKQEQRKALLKQRASQFQIPIVYANSVGGQDDLVFDGGSMVVDAQGNVAHEAPRFLPHVLYASIHTQTDTSDTGETRQQIVLSQQRKAPLALSQVAETYQALVVGLRDYVNNSGFKGILLGLSGGIDSALTLCIAVDALGADKVYAVMMPYEYTSQISLQDAQAQARRLNVSYTVCPIHPAVEGMRHTLEPMFANTKADTTEENIQARARGVILMALSNKFGHLVVTTGNKSEMAVGYATLYGDMAGGFDVLKDVYKTQVYALANYRNRLEESPVIPERVITRPPSAELRPDQKDQDSLPDYDVLDKILELYIDRDFGFDAIVEAGYDKAVVHKVLTMVDRNEYKRRQSAIGTKITHRAFGRERRYPLVNHWALEFPKL